MYVLVHNVGYNRYILCGVGTYTYDNYHLYHIWNFTQYRLHANRPTFAEIRALRSSTLSSWQRWKKMDDRQNDRNKRRINNSESRSTRTLTHARTHTRTRLYYILSNERVLHTIIYNMYIAAESSLVGPGRGDAALERLV